MTEIQSLERAPAPGISLQSRIATLAVIILPFSGLIAAIIHFWGWGVTGVELSLMLGMYLLTVIGITVGFHRLFTHRAFETHPAVEALLAVLGSMAIQGPLLRWVAMHRRHHQFSDEADDPHSPHAYGTGVQGLLRGAWHAHMGWFFSPDPPELARYTKDLSRSALLRGISALFPLWVILSLLIPMVLGGVMSGSWKGALLGLLWGGLVRIFLVHHVTWSINSVCHLWGSQPFHSRDQSRNNVIFGILGLGEGWHNNHHAFPSSARHGLRWWQIDVSYWIIQGLTATGLAWNVRLPAKRDRTSL